MDENRAYLGTGWDFPPSFEVAAKGTKMTSNVEDINRSLEILLSTTQGERSMHPEYGLNMERMLFEPLDLTLRTYMQELIRRAIINFEPRIKLEKVSLTVSPEEGAINVFIDYLVRGTNSRYNYVYPFYKNEGINIST